MYTLIMKKKNEDEIDEVEKLNNLKVQIEKLEKSKQIEILRILVNSQKVSINENQYGIHINLTDLPKELIDEMNLYIDYINQQEKELADGEQIKNDYKVNYFN